MSYPNNPGFQAHSETSRAAAKTIDTKSLVKNIYELIEDHAGFGQTADEIAATFDIYPGTASARLRELELNRRIVKTKKRRKTRANKQAVVYITSYYAAANNIAIDIKETKTAPGTCHCKDYIERLEKALDKAHELSIKIGIKMDRQDARSSMVKELYKVTLIQNIKLFAGKL